HSGVTNLGDNPFLFCSSMTEIIVDTNNQFYSSVDGVLFNKNQTTLLQWPEGKPGSVTIPNSVTTIGHSAFNSCQTLTNLTIPATVTNIEALAFQTSSLTSVNIPGTITAVGQAAFNGCTGLTNITIGNGVVTLGGTAFGGCINLTSVHIPDSVTGIGSSAL